MDLNYILDNKNAKSFGISYYVEQQWIKEPIRNFLTMEMMSPYLERG